LRMIEKPPMGNTQPDVFAFNGHVCDERGLTGRVGRNSFEGAGQAILGPQPGA
jgi:hypothetical protein